MRTSLSQVLTVTKVRPAADHNIEQYLMTAESLYHQINRILSNFDSDESILFLGDDDHLSLFLAQYVDGPIVVIENDERVIRSLEKLRDKYRLTNYQVVRHDLRYELPGKYIGAFGYCILNPPYSSKNEGFGIKVWLSRALAALRINGRGLLVLPIDEEHAWSMKNFLMVQHFLADSRAPILTIEKDLHTYDDLPDQGLVSSNIWFVKLEDIVASQHIINDVPTTQSLYR